MGQAAPRFYYGWYIAAVCVVVYFFTNGMTIFIPQNLFPRLMEEFSADAGQVSLSTSITFAGTALLAPLVGTLIDRLGVLKIIRIGLTVLGISFACYPFAASLQQIYLLHIGFAFGLVLCGLMPNVVLLSEWFVRYRGAVIGLLASASSLAGGVLPLAISPLVNDPAYGWRWGFGALAVAFVLFAWLPGLFGLKASPADVGQLPDGREPDAADDKDSESQPESVQQKDGVPFAVAIRSRTLWALALSSACLWYSFNAMNSQATIFFEQEAGMAPAAATALFATIFWCAFVGKFIFGALSDMFAKQRVMLLTAILMFAGCCLIFDTNGTELRLITDTSRLTLFAIVFGLGYGGVFTMIQLVCVDFFGQRDLGKVLGIIIFLDSIGGALGMAVSGQLKASSGSYLVPFMAVTCIAFVAIIGVMLIRPVRVPANT